MGTSSSKKIMQHVGGYCKLPNSIPLTWRFSSKKMDDPEACITKTCFTYMISLVVDSHLLCQKKGTPPLKETQKFRTNSSTEMGVFFSIQHYKSNMSFPDFEFEPLLKPLTWGVDPQTSSPAK